MNLAAQILLKNALDRISKKNLDEAEELLKKALISAPNHPDILRFMSVVAALKFDYFKALELIDTAIAAAPKNGIAYSNRGNILQELGRYEDALVSFDKAIRLLPGYAEAYNNKGNVLQDLQRFEEAMDWYDKAIAIDPKYAKAYCNKSNALDWLHRHEEAMQCLNNALLLEPGNVDAYWQKGLIQLASGNFELGWQNYEARWTKTNPVKLENMHIPRLEQLEDISGKSLLVWAEQGLGDTIQFCRYIKILSGLGAHITFLVPQALLNILSPLSEYCDLSSASICGVKTFDYQSPLLTLPLLFGTTVDTVPREIPYLHADPEKKLHFEKILSPSRNLKVGVVWSGGFRAMYSDGYLAGCRRNIELDQIATLKEIRGIDFFSLQKGDPAESEFRLRKDQVWPQMVDCAHLLNDFTDTAALIECLDLVIAVDTSTAHLAGALGKPVWMLNRFDSCWRWLRGKKDTPWYLNFTIYQQEKPGDWSLPIEKIKVDLLALSATHSNANN